MKLEVQKVDNAYMVKCPRTEENVDIHHVCQSCNWLTIRSLECVKCRWTKEKEELTNRNRYYENTL